MIADRISKSFTADRGAGGLVLASIAIALLISLGTIWGARLLGVDVGSALPAALGAAGGSAFAARNRQRRRGGA